MAALDPTRSGIAIAACATSSAAAASTRPGARPQPPASATPARACSAFDRQAIARTRAATDANRADPDGTPIPTADLAADRTMPASSTRDQAGSPGRFQTCEYGVSGPASPNTVDAARPGLDPQTPAPCGRRPDRASSSRHRDSRGGRADGGPTRPQRSAGRTGRAGGHRWRTAAAAASLREAADREARVSASLARPARRSASTHSRRAGEPKGRAAARAAFLMSVIRCSARVKSPAQQDAQCAAKAITRTSDDAASACASSSRARWPAGNRSPER